MNDKLLLFDIDGTLISTHGIPRKAMGKVLMERYDNFNYDDGFNFSGRTDWEIVEHLLRFDDRKVDTETVHSILDSFAAELDVHLKNGKKPLIYPGVIELLERLSQSENIYLGLVTGNILRGAEIKLSSAGLWGYFPVGGYGDDARNRSDLPPIAIERARDHYKISFKEPDIWIIGDSTRDVACAKDNRLRSLAVSTGWTEYDVLKKCQPDHLLTDLSALDHLMNIFYNN